MNTIRDEIVSYQCFHFSRQTTTKFVAYAQFLPSHQSKSVHIFILDIKLTSSFSSLFSYRFWSVRGGHQWKSKRKIVRQIKGEFRSQERRQWCTTLWIVFFPHHIVLLLHTDTMSYLVSMKIVECRIYLWAVGFGVVCTHSETSVNINKCRINLNIRSCTNVCVRPVSLLYP